MTRQIDVGMLGGGCGCGVGVGVRGGGVTSAAKYKHISMISLPYIRLIAPKLYDRQNVLYT